MIKLKAAELSFLGIELENVKSCGFHLSVFNGYVVRTVSYIESRG